VHTSVLGARTKDQTKPTNFVKMLNNLKRLGTFLLTLVSPPITYEEAVEADVKYYLEQFPDLTEEEVRETIYIIDEIYGDEEDPVEV